MKSLLTVLKFELSNFLKNKVYKISTILLSLIVIIGLSIPTIMNAFGKPLFGDNKGKDNSVSESKVKYAVLIENNVVELNDLKAQLSGNDIINTTNEEELNDLVASNSVAAGFIISSPTKYQYLVKKYKYRR